MEAVDEAICRAETPGEDFVFCFLMEFGLSPDMLSKIGRPSYRKRGPRRRLENEWELSH